MSVHDEDDAIEPDDSEEAYEVGYGKPPKQTQFKKGNKKGGRKKGSKNLKTMVAEAFGAKVTAKVNGEETKITKAEASIHQLANKAAAGDLKAIDKGVSLQQQYLPQEDPTGPTPEQLKPDIDTLRSYLAWQDQLSASVEDDPNDDACDGDDDDG